MLMHGSMQGRWVPQEKESNGFDSMEKKKKKGGRGGEERVTKWTQREKIQRRRK